MRKIVFIFLAAVLILFQTGLAFAENESGRIQNSDKPVIGVILPFSSAFEGIAKEQKNAIEMALSEMQPNVEVIFSDGKDDPAGAVAAFNKLAGSRNPPVAVISCASWASSAIHPLAAEKGIFHIAIASAIIDRTQPGHTIRFTLDAKKEERQLAQYLSRFNRIAVFNMDNGYGNNWAEIIKDNFKEKIVASIAYDPRLKDFGDQLAAIKKKNPDVLVLLSASNAARIAKQARQIGIDAQFVGTRPIERPELLAEPATNGLVYTYPSHSFRHHLIDDYKNAHNTIPTFFGIEAYDAFATLVSAIEEGKKSPETLFDWYAGRTFTGALGEYRFNENGDAVYPYMYKQIQDGSFEVADFQFALLLEKTRQQLNDIFDDMDKTLEYAAEKLTHTGLTGENAQNVLNDLFKQNPHAFDCTTVNREGRIVSVVPDACFRLIGLDISGKKYILRLHQTKKPVFSQAIDTMEGFMGFELQHPVFDKDDQFIGSVGMITRPDFFGSVITQKIANFPVEMWMIQKDGKMIYDVNEEELGKNLFTDELYADYPSVREAGREVTTLPQGSGLYEFYDKSMERIVEKTLIWTTVALHGTEFRLALTHVADDFRQ